MRLLLLALILANAVYFAWTQSFFRAYGFAPVQQSEPQRLGQQIKPEAVRLLSSGDVKRMEEQAQAESAPKECLMAGPFDEEQTAALRKALEAALPAAAWQLDAVQISERWIVYMGKYADQDALLKKRAELSTMNLKIEALNNPELEPGLSLGGFDTQSEAAQQLARLSQRGIRTARVVLERPGAKAANLKLPAMTEGMKLRLVDIRAVLAGKSLHSCSESGH